MSNLWATNTFRALNDYKLRTQPWLCDFVPCYDVYLDVALYYSRMEKNNDIKQSCFVRQESGTSLEPVW